MPIDQKISFYASVLGRHLDRVGFGRCDVISVSEMFVTKFKGSKTIIRGLKFLP